MAYEGHEAVGVIDVVLDDGAFVPERAHIGDAGLDIRTPVKVTLKAHSSVTIDTGVHCEIPFGWEGSLESKSGLNVNHDLISCGTIDYGYTGSIVAKIYNLGDKDYVFERGDKITQLVISPCWLAKPRVVEKLHGSERGDNGFGSTGK